jgi:carboxymethylenebutenolidase
VKKSCLLLYFLAPDAPPLEVIPNDDEGRLCKVVVTGMNSEDLLSFFSMKAHKECNGKVGVVGFCFGGWVSNMMAVRLPDLAAAVPFYGGQAPLEDVPKIKAPLQLHYAGLDTRVNEGWPAYEKALKDNGKDYTAYMYPEVNHGFHNDSTPVTIGAAELMATNSRWQN